MGVAFCVTDSKYAQTHLDDQLKFAQSLHVPCGIVMIDYHELQVAEGG